LYYRLNVLPLYIPPLRQRIDDIPALADFFMKKCRNEVKKDFSLKEQVRKLENHYKELLS